MSLSTFLRPVYCQSQDMWSHSPVITWKINYASVNILTTVHWLLITKHAVTFTSHQLQLSNSPSTTCRPSVTRRDHIHLSPLCNNNYASVNILTTVYCHSQDMWSHSLVITCNNTYAAINSFATVHRLSEMNQVTTFTSHYIYVQQYESIKQPVNHKVRTWPAFLLYLWVSHVSQSI